MTTNQPIQPPPITVRMLKANLFAPKLPYLKVTDIIWALRNTNYEIKQLANVLESALKDRDLL